MATSLEVFRVTGGACGSRGAVVVWRGAKRAATHTASAPAQRAEERACSRRVCVVRLGPTLGREHPPDYPLSFRERQARVIPKLRVASYQNEFIPPLTEF